MELQTIVILCLLGASSAFLDFDTTTSTKWDDLKVTWGANPFNSQYFDSLPRTTSEATDAGWLELTKCDTSDTVTARGRRYTHDDMAVILLFDKNGYIAGIQTEIPGNKDPNYPSKSLVPPFVKWGFNYFMTVYFTEPASICSTGRSGEDFANDGTGTDLYIQTGPHPDTDFMKIPHKEEDLTDTKWVEGKCFWTMGKHYWYNITDDMSCDEMFPVFLLYNKGRVNAFGWVLTVPLPGPRYEHPGDATYKLFMESVPKCLSDRGTISTMHIYLTNSPKTNFC